MEDLVAELLEQKDLKLKLKLNKDNVMQKIYIHTLSSSIPCTYSLFADHIVDVQCSGAYEKVRADSLVPKGAKHEEVDLLFLDLGQLDQDLSSQSALNQSDNSKQMEINQQDVTYVNSLQYILCKFGSGKLTRGWIFIIANPDSTTKIALKKLQNDLFQDKKQFVQNIRYQFPYCSNLQKAMNYFEQKDFIFNVVIDLQNAEQLIGKPNLQRNIRFIYIYLKDVSAQTEQKALKIKSKQKKVRDFYNQCNLPHLLETAYFEMQSSTKFINLNGSIVPGKKKLSSMRTFFKLNNEYKSEMTMYRFCLYGAMKLSDAQERWQKLNEFEKLVTRVQYENVNLHELQNLEKYLKIDHESCQFDDRAKHESILKFQQMENFYYKITNNLLRCCLTMDQFGPCAIPFNESYHAIKYFYNKTYPFDKKGVRKLKNLTLFRAASMSQIEFSQLRVGDYIQLLGFLSTTKKREVALQYVGTGNQIFVISINERSISDKFKDFDHGFVDLNEDRNGQAFFQHEEQVLLNACNTYKVTAIIISEDVKEVHLEYGAIFDLLEKDPKDLQEEEAALLIHQKYCARKMKEIKGQSDARLKIEELQKEISVFNVKSSNGQKPKAENSFGKLADVWSEIID